MGNDFLNVMADRKVRLSGTWSVICRILTHEAAATSRESPPGADYDSSHNAAKLRNTGAALNSLKQFRIYTVVPTSCPIKMGVVYQRNQYEPFQACAKRGSAPGFLRQTGTRLHSSATLELSTAAKVIFSPSVQEKVVTWEGNCRLGTVSPQRRYDPDVLCPSKSARHSKKP